MEKTCREEERCRVLLKGIESDSPQKREWFCRQISEKYRVSSSLLENILDRCPIILRKNLSLRKAQALARTLRQYGGQVSVEEKRDTPPILLEFQHTVPQILALESARLWKTRGGTWTMTGRVKNISDMELCDLWVLVQLFERAETLLTFEEVPIILNPLPAGESSPFRVLFDGDLVFCRASLAFKSAAGVPLTSEDRRKGEEWDEVEIKGEADRDSRYTSPGFGTESRSVDVTESLEGFSVEHGSFTAEGSPVRPVPEAHAIPALNEERSPEVTLVTALEKPVSVSETVATTEGLSETSFSAEPGAEEIQAENTPGSTEQDALPEETPGSHPDLSVFREATNLLNAIDRRIEEKVEPDPPPFPWIEQFRDAIRCYDRECRDSFAVWFKENRKEGRFEGGIHSLVTILAHARFDQAGEEGNALENTKRVAPLIMNSTLTLEETPSLEATQHFPAESWKRFFQKALPRLQRVGRDIAARDAWDATELERLIQIIPHMSGQTSRRAVRWMSELVPDLVAIDFSKTTVIIGESLFRVATRLGVVTPQFDTYQDTASMGYAKIQSFAKRAFPEDPVKIEDPLTFLGMNGNSGGHCTPIQPCCEGCPFEGFCPRLHISPIHS